ncbi:MAG: hypothetical protein VX495_00325, partial [Nitrospinota bacterium]|nr:hypothetical protein [Nitrospinota bacterium]
NGKGITGAHAAAPIWSLIMQEALEKGDQRDFPIPLEIRFENANSSDGFYEKKDSPNSIRVALNKNNTLPRHSKTVPVSGLFDTGKAAPLKIKHPARVVKDVNPVEISEHGSSLDSKIWFMLNLENASMGKIKRIPTRWFIEMLEETKNKENTSPERLIKGRKILIEKLLSRVGSFDHKIMKGMAIRSILRPNEAKVYGVQY